MIFTIVIILIVVLIIVAIVVNALQQHKEKVEAEKRAELAKLKAIVDETEQVLLSSEHMPVSQKLIFILNQRITNALRSIKDGNPDFPEIKKRLQEAETKTGSIDQIAPPPSNDSFHLPNNDKQIIQYIQAVKKLRILLRSEHSKGQVDTQSFSAEDKRLESLQLRVNVETLSKRGNAALKTNLLGSARQYFEKAIKALEAQSQPDEYNLSRKAALQKQLNSIQENLRNTNAQDAAKRQEEERDDLDELFAPKKKW